MWINYSFIGLFGIRFLLNINRVLMFFFSHYQHCSSDDTLTSPLILVTASVDRIALKKPILVERDVTIVGSVTWVGRSSMEIQLLVTQVAKGSITTMLCLFLYF